MSASSGSVSDTVRDDLRDEIQGDAGGGERPGVSRGVRGASGRLQAEAGTGQGSGGRGVQPGVWHREEDHHQAPPWHSLWEDSLRGEFQKSLRLTLHFYISRRVRQITAPSCLGGPSASTPHRTSPWTVLRRCATSSLRRCANRWSSLRLFLRFI